MKILPSLIRIAIPLLVIAAASAGVAMEKLAVTISGSGAKNGFTVELANNIKDQEHGLMGRKTLADDEGMLFYFSRERRPVMWMKDTLVPLDMIFIGKNGKVAEINENAAPLSEKRIYPQKPVIAVMEIKGGVAHKLGIKTGDLVTGLPGK